MKKLYDSSLFFDEMFDGNKPKPHYRSFHHKLSLFSQEQLEEKYRQAQASFLRQGITFTVYGTQDGTERTMPFDCVPIIIPQRQWTHIEAGVKQRVEALNLFLQDVYGQQNILRDGLIPRQLVENNPYFKHMMTGLQVPIKNHIFLAGIDLIRDEKGLYHVLEDNLRNPSGISYVFENRDVMKEVYPEFFSKHTILPLDKQMCYMKKALLAHRPPFMQADREPKAVLLTAGIYNSAYYDHVFLAQHLNIKLVEGRDLVVQDMKVYMKTIYGLQQVDIIYRRIDDDFLDPAVFREDSLLGVPHLMAAYQAGHVAILNAVGNGVADDKAMYAYVPDMIRYYLQEEPILPNVKTYHLGDDKQREWVLKHMQELVIKNVSASGGYDMLIGPHASEEEIALFKQKICKNPLQYIAQPTIKLSRAPAFQNGRFYPCHVDLRVYVMKGEDCYVLPGGLSRVALEEGSLVVNSSQGGGAKDTWILKEELQHAKSSSRRVVLDGSV
ncbi:circularly permuted type 2 ATP-grasp protein [Lysinibacillus irui]|uniref:Circularly permuted type 2 ATP-grasp protein n=1 Tax=Lysinibacillus irui TaxID=2998077 RepID=A0ABU5NI93_9BACI|nr:circularly permuted type 2 ATP-grasp protein [Lysinibacillus irui]MEA0553145.1 circularly permuted type 2 ATP-grasp protein [Lysinibacillus irui]MEA0975725.1 circularly permuted type 2 ATP-grasp protein [Lysinibacillus irui]MEA1041879.1 circularly permuted type 2 ATP-grasp protein [Lysinibacillus irui]